MDQLTVGLDLEPRLGRADPLVINAPARPLRSSDLVDGRICNVARARILGSAMPRKELHEQFRIFGLFVAPKPTRERPHFQGPWTVSKALLWLCNDPEVSA
jgi:hypothetical protein